MSDLKVIEKFDGYFMPRKNITYSRYKFFTYRQEETQPFNEYLTVMTKLANDSELKLEKDNLLRDMLVIGLNNKRLQEKLMRELDLTLDKVIKACQNDELTHEHVKQIQEKKKDDDVSIDKIGKHRSRSDTTRRRKNPGNSSDSEDDHYSESELINSCKYCAESHKRGACPAYTSRCNLCNRKGHYSRCCFNKKSNKKHVRSVQQVEDESSQESDEDEYEDVYEDFFIG